MKKILLFFTKRIIRLCVMLVLACVFVFILLSNSPIDPVRAYIGKDMLNISPAQKEKIAKKWDMDLSGFERFKKWNGALLNLELGRSMIYDEPVTEVIKKRFLASLWLMMGAWTFSGLIGFLIGAMSGIWENSIFDKLGRFYCFCLASAPTFWIGLLLLIVFSINLGWFPYCCGSPPGIILSQASFGERIYHLILPVSTLAVLGVANVALHTREKVIDVLRSDYALFLISKGAKKYEIVCKYALRNTLTPAIVIHFSSFGELFGGSVLAEQVFSYPGLGEATVQAGLKGDAPLLLGITIFATIFVYCGNTIADILIKCIDPKLKFENKHVN